MFWKPSPPVPPGHDESATPPAEKAQHKAQRTRVDLVRDGATWCETGPSPNKPHIRPKSQRAASLCEIRRVLTSI